LDKTAFKNQTFEGIKRERREDLNLVSGLNMRANCHRQKGTSLGSIPRHFDTDIIGICF
jgi:hypothetical protein